MKKFLSFILSAVMIFSIIAVSPLTVNVNADDLTGSAGASKVKNPTLNTNLKAGDKFFAGIDAKTGNLNGKLASGSFDLDDPMYRLEIKEDGTVSIEFFYWSVFEYKGAAAFLNPKTLVAGDVLIIPDKVNGYTVSEIVNNWTGFSDTGVKKIVIPETIEKIDKEAFKGNFFLEEVEFAGKSRLKEIGYGAFADCRSLKTITIPASVETIGEFAFCNTDMSIDEKYRRSNVHYVDGHLGGNFITLSGTAVGVDITYNDDSQVESYRITEPKLVFDDVYSLTSIKFEEGSKVKSIGYGTFAWQKALTTIELPKGLEALSCTAFYGNSANQTIIEIAESAGITILDRKDDDASNAKSDSQTESKTETKTDKKTDTKPTTKPAAKNNMPKIKSAKSNLTCTIDISWKDVGAPYYIVYIAKEGSTKYTNCGIFKGTTATITTFGKGDNAKKLGCGSTYQIRVIRSDYTGELSAALGECTPVKVTVK